VTRHRTRGRGAGRFGAGPAGRRLSNRSLPPPPRTAV